MKCDSAEPVERRVLAERKTVHTTVTATQSVGETDSGLHSLRLAARRDAQLQFNNLLHHVDIRLLAKAYRALNGNAALGVDGVSWDEYGDDLRHKLTDLHRRIHAGSYRPEPSKRTHSVSLVVLLAISPKPNPEWAV
jgi:RNA-directed DNA polymerase